MSKQNFTTPEWTYHIWEAGSAEWPMCLSTHHNPVESITRFATCFQAGYLARPLRPWKWRQYIPPKRRLTFNGLDDVMYQKIVIFKITAVYAVYTRRLWSILGVWNEARCPGLNRSELTVYSLSSTTADCVYNIWSVFVWLGQSLKPCSKQKQVNGISVYSAVHYT
jgi:hypothetical protein